MLPDISLQGNCSFDARGGKYCANTSYIIPGSDKYLLGLLNSSLITFYYKGISSSYRGGYLRFIYQYLAKLPIRLIDSNDKAEKALHDKMVKLVKQMLGLHERLGKARTNHEETAIKRQIEATDNQIDALGYKLYGLTDKEIKIIEQSTK